MPHKKKRSTGRRGRYISPGSTQIVITLNTVNGETPPQGLLRTVTTELTSGPGGNCTAGAGTQSCTVSGPAVPVGVDNITFNAEDAFDHSLSAVTQNFTVHAGQANSFSASLLGVPNSFTLYTSGLTAGTPVASQGVTLKVYDAAGDQIVGPANFSQTIQLQSLENVYDAFGAAKLSVNGGTAGSSVNVTNPDDTVTLSYSGLSITPFELEAGASGASPALQGGRRHERRSGRRVFRRGRERLRVRSASQSVQQRSADRIDRQPDVDAAGLHRIAVPSRYNRNRHVRRRGREHRVDHAHRFHEPRRERKRLRRFYDRNAGPGARTARLRSRAATR